ncbi:ESX secretion-associated protein EspG [Nocardia donostiensis]|uniref:ESX secretion-associated protein EspG n=1 Tax=Nocardia donostiensis TaxID=1538463 RepID=A0A1W0BLI7_9NOCA|nr:ESX secretion-associated protein EspG [Nocardia donostiensis]ONM46571.1 ESX secretion-associated protein EspG [Nocardia donostiensis]OQS16948.1 ESX secretion-associated protein EspG [Nocardia donostiensis]OQS23329.1 ESX secretion-associated protein EspG [Nocardia donostiensis]
MSWTFTPDEFAHIWRETDLDRYPYPLRILETPGTEYEAETLRTRLQQRLPLGSDPDLSACLRILAAPHTRIVTVGATTRRGGEIRLLACTVFDRAVLAIQEPGTTPDFGGRVRITIGHTAKLGARITAHLPGTPAGRHPARSASAAAVRDDELVVPDQRAAPAIRRLLRKPLTSQGHIRVEPRIDRPTPPPAIHYTWIDIESDGRYLIKSDDTVHLVPASPTQLAAQLQKRIPS